MKSHKPSFCAFFGEKLQIKENMSVLDIGCGWGGMAFEIVGSLRRISGENGVAGIFLPRIYIAKKWLNENEPLCILQPFGPSPVASLSG